MPAWYDNNYYNPQEIKDRNPLKLLYGSAQDLDRIYIVLSEDYVFGFKYTIDKLIRAG